MMWVYYMLKCMILQYSSLYHQKCYHHHVEPPLMLFAQAKSRKILFHTVRVCPPVLQFIVIDQKERKKKSIISLMIFYQNVIRIPNRERNHNFICIDFLSFMNSLLSHLLDDEMIFHSYLCVYHIQSYLPGAHLIFNTVLKFIFTISLFKTYNNIKKFNLKLKKYIIFK